MNRRGFLALLGGLVAAAATVSIPETAVAAPENAAQPAELDTAEAQYYRRRRRYRRRVYYRRRPRRVYRRVYYRRPVRRVYYRRPVRRVYYRIF